MGQCGCESDPIAKLRGREGEWFVLEVYPGCADCGTSWGLGVTEVREDDDEFFLLEAPAVTFDKLGMWGTSILDTGILRKEFEKEAGEDGEDSYHNDALEEFIGRGGLRTVYHATRRAARPSSLDSPSVNG